MRKTAYILIGPQGSGKTYWAKNVLLAHNNTIVRISQDDQGRQGHRDLFTQCMNEGQSVVVDRMNFNFQQRDRYVDAARNLGYYVIFVWFKIGEVVCLSRLARRKNHPTISIDSDHSNIIDFYFENFEAPCHSEYDEMLTINEKGLATILDLETICHDKKIIVVGDIHGCFDTFLELLNKCEYDDGDIVVSTGDLVDRGPKSKETLLWFRHTPFTYTVMGNHDNKLMRYWKGNPVKMTNGLDLTIDQCQNLNPVEWSSWLQSLPHIIKLPNIYDLTDDKQLYVVHAGVDGRRSVYRQRIETCLYTRFFDGKDFFDEEGGIPWWKTLDNDYFVASGHIITDDCRPCRSAYCLDGGAYQGGCLRALVIDGPGCSIKEVKIGLRKTQK